MGYKISAQEKQKILVLVFQKDLSQIISELKEKRSELSSVYLEIEQMRKKFYELSVKEAPLINGLKKQIDHLNLEKSTLESEVRGWQKQKQKQKEEYLLAWNKSLKIKEQQMKEKELEITFVSEKTKEADKKLDSVIQNIKSEESFLKKIEFSVDQKLSLQKELEELNLTRKSLVSEIIDLTDRRDNVLKLFKELNEYRDSLDKRENDLIKDYQQVLLMKNRLKPKYLKAFGKYANL